MARIVVIGAGVGGMAAAARLAAGGHAVTMVERSPTVGGKLGIAEWHLPEGVFRFDTGPSLVTMPHVLADLFVQTGEPVDRCLHLRRLDPICRYRFPDGAGFDAADGLEAFTAELDRALGPGAGDDWRRLHARARRMWAATEQPFLRSPINGLVDIGRLARQLADVPTIAPWQSLRSLGSSTLRDDRLRMYLDRYATYTGSDPRRAPAVLATIPYVEQAYGGWYVDGGLRRIAEALLERCITLGVDVVTVGEVTAIGLEGGRVGHVVVGGSQRLEADVVVANADASHVYGSLLPGPGPGSGGGDDVTRMRRSIATAPPSLSGFVMLLALRGRTAGLAHHTVLFPADQRTYDGEFDGVFGRPDRPGRPGRPARPVAEPTVFVTSPDDPAVRPEGHEAWFVLVNAARHGSGEDGATVDWDAPGLADGYAERVLAVLARRGLDVRDRILRREVRTPADLERATGAPGGSIYGTSSNGWRSSFLRPPNRGAVPGLYLVGGSSHPGGGLPLVLLSAQITAGLIGPA